MHSNPNRPLPGANHPEPEPRRTGPAGRGDAAHDGYSVIGRRPRVRGFDEPLPAAEADRIEDIYGDFPGMGPRPFPY